MFLGEYQANFTGQGRIILPKKFRESLIGGKELILSRGLEGCIWGFSVKEFKKEAKKQLELSVTDQKGREFRRYLFSAAEKVFLDEQGRFVIPGILLIHARLEDRAVIIGAGDHFEVWNPQQWGKILAGLINIGEKNE